MTDFLARPARASRSSGYDGWCTVEQDCDPAGPTSPVADARANRRLSRVNRIRLSDRSSMRKLNWGLIGGGEGSQIGPAHRIGAALDGLFAFAAGALDVDPGTRPRVCDAARHRAGSGLWRLARRCSRRERSRADRIDLVTVATPNATHYEIAKAFLEAGFAVLCEKPMTMTVEEAEDIVAHGASARQRSSRSTTATPAMRWCVTCARMVARGDLGRVRLVKAEFAHGFHADAADADNPRVRWRYDPAQAGTSAQFADCGIHALHMASFICGQQPRELSADFVSTHRRAARSRTTRWSTSAWTAALCSRLWTSAVAIGRMHGLSIQVFGEKGGLRWAQEWPNQLYWTPLNGRTSDYRARRSRPLARSRPRLARHDRPRRGVAARLRQHLRRPCRADPRAQGRPRAEPARLPLPDRRGWSPLDRRDRRRGGFREGAQANGPTRVRLPCG